MLQRILGVTLIVCGLVAVVLGVASATVWRTSPTATASTTTVAPDATTATLVTTAPGVLDLVDPDVHVRATSPSGGDVVIAVGSATDIAGWVGDDPLVTVDGLTDWQTLKTSTSGSAPSGKAPSGTAPDPSGSDMWTQVVKGSGSASIALADVPSDATILVAGVGPDAAQPTLALTWDRTVTTPYLWPLVLAGLGLVAVGAVVLAVGRSRARSHRAAAARAAVRRPDAGTSLGQDPARPLTRRELREQAERIGRESAKGRGRNAPPPAPPVVEAPAETVAIQVPEETRGAADAWRRRWNVPARIEPAGDPVLAPAARPAAEPERNGQTSARHGAPVQPPAPMAVWSPMRPAPRPPQTPHDDAPQDGGRQ